jgi:uncharacterized protein (DUF305 family)
MNNSVEHEAEQPETKTEQPPKDRASLAMAAAAVVVLIATVVVVWALLRTAAPGDSSPEAGFARDMSEHHHQAVEMALIIQQRTEVEDLRFVTTDMMLTQQAQIGQMRGWLDIWDLHPAADPPYMEWMGHPTHGRMPGMASREDIERLRELPVEEAEGLFLELMIIHHQAGVEMADAALDLSDNDAVRNLAESISRAQVSEIENMQRMRERLGFERVDVQPQIHDNHEDDD